MKPFTIFGRRFETCHVLPATVMVLLLAAITAAALAVASHWIPPVQLSAIWLEPNTFRVEDVAAGKATFTLKKSGKWKRFCPVDARQSYIDEKGTIQFRGEVHAVEVPKPEPEPTAGNGTTMRAKPRKEPDVVPKILAASPGKWRLRLVNVNGACWPWELLWPIVPSEYVEAPFEIR